MTILEATLARAAARNIEEHGVISATRRFAYVCGACAWVLAMTYVGLVVHWMGSGLSHAVGLALLGVFFASTIGASNHVFLTGLRPGATEREAQLARLLADEQETVERLRELRVARDDIVTQVSHEIRTPVTIVSGSVRVLVERDEALPRSDRHQLLTAISRAADRLLDLPDLLDRIMRPDDVDGLRRLARSTNDTDGPAALGAAGGSVLVEEADEPVLVSSRRT